MSGMARTDNLRSFYDVLSRLERKSGSAFEFGLCTGRQPWPERGVYFIFEPNETRVNSGSGPRVVRVGTHALRDTSNTRLWTRLKQHRGRSRTRGGNHRGSIFRLLIGLALMAKEPALFIPTWGRDVSLN